MYMYTYPLYLDKENVTRYKFIMFFSSMQMIKNASSLSLRIATFLACSWHLVQFQPQRSYKNVSYKQGV